jgi:hypothetical protein
MNSTLTTQALETRFPDRTEEEDEGAEILSAAYLIPSLGKDVMAGIDRSRLAALGARALEQLGATSQATLTAGQELLLRSVDSVVKEARIPEDQALIRLAEMGARAYRRKQEIEDLRRRRMLAFEAAWYGGGHDDLPSAAESIASAQRSLGIDGRSWWARLRRN